MKLQDVTPKKLLTRRNALKSTILSAAVALPIMNNVPGVSAASLGFDQPDVRVLPLTGKLLQQELKKLRTLSDLVRAEGFLAQKGLVVSEPLAEGYYLYRKTGNHWSQETILMMSYIQSHVASQVATITYSQNSQERTLNIVVANTVVKTGEGYIVHENGTIELVAQLKAQGNKAELILAQQYEHALQGNAVAPASVQCTLCRVVCGGLVSTGCSILGAAFTCGRVCLPLAEDPPCLALCAVAYRIVCSVAGGFDCVQLVCSNTLHVC